MKKKVDFENEAIDLVPPIREDQERKARSERLAEFQRIDAELEEIREERFSTLDEDHSASPDFPVELLPPVLRDVAQEVARTLGTPIEFAALAALAINSALPGKGIQLRYGNRLTTPNLFVVVAADSGTGKSSTVSILMRPLEEFQYLKSGEWKADVLPSLQAEEQDLKARLSRMDRARSQKAEVGEPVESSLTTRTRILKRLAELARLKRNPFRLIAEDSTQESFIQMLNAAGGAIFSFSADAGRPIDNLLGRFTHGRGADDSHYLKAFSGDPIRTARVGRDEDEILDPCASLLWLTTPDRAELLRASDALMRGGFLARILFADIEIDDLMELEGEQRRINEGVLQRYRDYCFAVLNAYRITSELRPPVELEQDAEALLREFHNDKVRELLREARDLRPFTRRLREHALRLALGLHVAKWGDDAHARRLDVETAFAATQIVTWVRGHQLAMLDDASHAARRQRLQRGWEIIQELAPKNGHRVYPRFFYQLRKLFRGKGCGRKARHLLDELTKEGVLLGPFEHFEDSITKGTVYYDIPKDLDVTSVTFVTEGVSRRKVFGRRR